MSKLPEKRYQEDPHELVTDTENTVHVLHLLGKEFVWGSGQGKFEKIQDIEQYIYGAPQPKRKEIITPSGMLSLASWAVKQGISRQRASILLKERRIPCAIQKGRYWYVPEKFVLEK